ncbi:MAG: signal peptide peptidase SppA [Acidobacteria bacterium]|nr:signal peptide peptidase SppA [Acidobacteriota bacterium]
MKKLLLSILALIGLAVLIAAGTIYFGGTERLQLAGDVVLKLRLAEPLVDYAPGPRVPFFDRSARNSLVDLYQALRAARTDSRIKGLAVYIQQATFGLAQAEELRRQIRAVADHGKVVECYLETAGEGTNGTLAYYVATACPKISLAPAGELNLVGLFLDSTFLRGTLDKLKIEPEFEHVGTYKSAAESYTDYQHSSSAREALSSLLDDLFERVVSDLAISRELPVSRIGQLIDGAPYNASEALALGLVDRLAYPDQFEESWQALLDEDWRWTDIEDYVAPRKTLGKTKIALAFAQGIIVRGSGGVDPWTRQRYIGADDFGKVLEELIEDASVAAVILRIDSPGGSAQASDLILRQVERLAAVKPVVVSMSNLAASGGYYIAAKAQHIVAETTTLTGSIGVVAGRLLTGRFQQELLGISHDTIKRGANADFFSSLDAFNPLQRERFLSMITEVYDTFVGHVASGRGMDREAVDAVAQGRVWSGRSALDKGLVDELGGFDAAWQSAADAVGLALEDTRLVLYPKPPSLFEFLTGEGGPGLLLHWLRNRLTVSFDVPMNLEMAPETARLSHLF